MTPLIWLIIGMFCLGCLSGIGSTLLWFDVSQKPKMATQAEMEELRREVRNLDRCLIRILRNNDSCVNRVREEMGIEKLPGP